MIVQEHIKDIMWSSAVGQVAGAEQDASGGILHGYVYFAVPKIPNAISERWYVTLTGDPTEYPLGDGTVANKVTISGLGVTADKEASVKIDSVDGVSAVSSIIRVTTVERIEEKTGYSTQEMDMHMSHLYGRLKSDIAKTDSGLSGKLDETRTELVSRINNTAADLRTYARREAQAAKEWAEANLILARTELTRDTDNKVGAARTDLTNLVNSKDSSIRELIALNGPQCTKWKLPGMYTIAQGGWSNIMFSAPETAVGSSLIQYNATNKTVTIAPEAFTVGRSRILQITTSLAVQLPSGFENHVSATLVGSDGTVFARVPAYLRTDHVVQEGTSVSHPLQAILQTFIGENEEHALKTTGMRVSIHNGGREIVVKADSHIMFTLI